MLGHEGEADVGIAAIDVERVAAAAIERHDLAAMAVVAGATLALDPADLGVARLGEGGPGKAGPGRLHPRRHVVDPGQHFRSNMPGQGRSSARLAGVKPSAP